MYGGEEEQTLILRCSSGCKSFASLSRAEERERDNATGNRILVMLPTILLSSSPALGFSLKLISIRYKELCENLRSQWLVWCAVEQTDTIKVTRRDGREGAISHPVRGAAMGWPSWSPRPSTLRECRSKSKAKPKLNCLPASSQLRCQ